MSHIYIKVQRGGNLSFDWVWEDANGNPIDITNSTVELVEASLGLQGRLSFVVADAARGLVVITIDGTTELLLENITQWFRVRLVDAQGNTQASPKMYIRVE